MQKSSCTNNCVLKKHLVCLFNYSKFYLSAVVIDAGVVMDDPWIQFLCGWMQYLTVAAG